MQQIQPWIDRLAAECPLLNVVEGLAEYSANPVVRHPPQAWVVPGGRASDGQFPVSQVVHRFTVLIGIRNRSDPRGEAAIKLDLEEVGSEIELAFAGWLPPGEDWDGPLVFRGDDLFEIDKHQNVIWYMKYELTQLVRPDLGDRVNC